MSEEQFIYLSILVFGILIGFIANHIYHISEIKELNEIIKSFRESSINFPDPPSRLGDFKYDKNVSNFFEDLEKFTDELNKKSERVNKEIGE